MKDTIVFVGDENHLSSDIPGGVQVCTQEYLALFRECGFELDVLPVRPKRDVWTRLTRKIIADPYARYDIPAITERAAERIRDTSASIVAINQVTLLGVGEALKGRFGDALGIIALSHGNESGDALHEIVRGEETWRNRSLQALRLGWMLMHEARTFIEGVDLMLCMSEIEQHIDAWLGANRSMVVPRTFDPQFLDWSPVRGRAGFVGTLDHLPNEEGIRRVLEALEKQELPPSVDLRIVGGPEATGRELERTFSAVTYCGRLPQVEFEAEVATWGLFLNPIWWYARGATTKLAQGISWGIPVVTTTPGMRGYTWTKGEVKVTDTPEAMAQVIVDAAEEPSVLSGWAEEVRTVARNGPTIDQVASEFEDHLRSLAGNVGRSES